MLHLRNPNRFAAISAVVKNPCREEIPVMAINQGIAHQYEVYCSPYGRMARIGFAMKQNKKAMMVQKTILIPVALKTKFSLSLPFFARSAA